MSSPVGSVVHRHPEDAAKAHKDLASERYRDLHKARKLRFFVNGDRYFRGKKMYIMPSRYYNFNDLLNDLTGKLPSNQNLPNGVRQIFTPVGGRKIFNIEDLSDGETYVCAGFEGFKMIKYGRFELEPWSVARPQPTHMADQELDLRASYNTRAYAYNAFHPGRYYRASQSYQHRRWPDSVGASPRAVYAPGSVSESIQSKPKVITVVKSGATPRKCVKMLLNRRALQSYEQIMADISEALDTNQGYKVRKLFTVRGKEVLGVADFFRGDNNFVAFDAEEPKMSESEILDILRDVYMDQNVVTAIMQEWKKNERRKRKVVSSSQVVASIKEENITQNVGGQVNPNHVQDKLDSGFDSIGASTNRSDPDQAERRGIQRPRKRIGMKREREKDQDRNSDVENQLETRNTSPPYGHYVIKKTEKERLRLANEENERTIKRHQNLIETERKFIIEHRRKRGILSMKNIDNPYRRSVYTKLKEKDVQKERVILVDEKIKAQKSEINKEEQKVVQNGVRNALVQSQEKKEENTQIEVTGQEQKSEYQKTCDNSSHIASKNEHDVIERIHDDRNSTKQQEAVVKEPTKTDNVQTPATVTVREVVHTSTESPHAINSDTNTSNSQEHKDNRKPDRDDQPQRLRPKARIVRKTKAQRLVSGDAYVLAIFELGRKLGDGNFAIVRHSRKKETGQEFAMKVIDKAKLKGKDHMVENEIDILKDCCHHNIVRLYEEYETVERIYLVMELVKGGDLFDAITQNVKFGETDAALMVKDLCNALFYMHSRSIVHRDLKPENLLVHRNRAGGVTLKLADFGLAMEVKELIYTVCGTPTYVAPEILTESGYGLEVDMWAVGVITYILLCGFPPFRSPDRKQTELFEYIKAGYFEFLSPYWDNTSRGAKDLISHLLIVDKKRRYTAVDVLCHRWILCGAQTDIVPAGAMTVEAAAKQTRRELEVQAKLNHESYQRLKEKKKHGWQQQEE